MIYQFDIWHARTVAGKVPAAHQYLTETRKLVLTNFKIPLYTEPDGRYRDVLHAEVSQGKNIIQIVEELNTLEDVLDVYVRECIDRKLMQLPKEDPTDYQ